MTVRLGCASWITEGDAHLLTDGYESRRMISLDRQDHWFLLDVERVSLVLRRKLGMALDEYIEDVASYASNI